MEITRDPHVLIMDRQDQMVEYLNDLGERWRIYGTCNQCGDCEPFEDKTIVFTGIPIGQPGAVYRLSDELDSPVRPELCNNKVKNPHCSLTGEYI